MDHRRPTHARRRTELGKHLAWDRRYFRGSGTVRRREAAERFGEGVFSGGSSSRVADGGDGAESPDQGARHEKGDDQPTDEPERRFGIVEEPAAGDERGGATRPLRHESGTSGREPRSRENQPHDKEHESHEQFEQLATIAAWLPVRVEVGEYSDAGKERDDPYDPRWAGRRSPVHAERRYLDPTEREERRHDSGDRDADHDEYDVDPVQREVAWREGRSRERHVVEQRSEGEEERETDGDARQRRHHRLHRGDHRNLTRRGTDEPHGGEALLAPRRRQPARRGDQDEHRQQEDDGSAGQDPLQIGSAPHGVLAGVAVGGGALDGSHLDRTRCPRELTRGMADDDDQRVRGRQRRCADGPIWRPGNRSRSSLAGWERGVVRAGEA